MKNTLETLQNALLIFTIVVLVYVLYKRLLRVLGKEEKSKKYPSLGEKVLWTDPTKANLEVNLEMKMPLEVAIHQADGQEIKKVLNAEYEPGKHLIEVDCTGLQTGKYYFKITSPFMESSQYFMVH